MCWYSGSGPDQDRLRLGNYIAADQRAGMGPQGGDAVIRVWSLLPKNFMGLRCWSIIVLQLCFGPEVLVANERRYPRRLVRLFFLVECDRNQDLKIRTVISAVESCNLRATINCRRGYPTNQKSPFKLLKLRRTLLFLVKLPRPATTDYYTIAKDCAKEL